MCRILWIEDQSKLDLVAYGTALLMADHDLIIAEDATSAVEKISAEQFDFVIVDIRLPPGNGKKWRIMYEQYRSDKMSARLGLRMLTAFFAQSDPEVIRPAWLIPERILVFTVETLAEIGKDLKELGIANHLEKQCTLDERILCKKIEDMEKLILSISNEIKSRE